MVISNIDVFGIENSFKGSKYPMSTDISSVNGKITPTIKKLAKSKTGSGHDQMLTGIIVQFDLTFTVKAWTEAERYHFFDFISSQSTMHRITKFDLNTAYIDYVDTRVVEIMKEKVSTYNKISGTIYDEPELEKLKQHQLKKLYLQILYTNPCGFKLTAKMTTNYRQLKTIYYQRKNHRLPEWQSFCKEIESLPYFKELFLED